jgi:hypothetical protein
MRVEIAWSLRSAQWHSRALHITTSAAKQSTGETQAPIRAGKGQDDEAIGFAGRETGAERQEEPLAEVAGVG